MSTQNHGNATVEPLSEDALATLIKGLPAEIASAPNLGAFALRLPQKEGVASPAEEGDIWMLPICDDGHVVIIVGHQEEAPSVIDGTVTTTVPC